MIMEFNFPNSILHPNNHNNIIQGQEIQIKESLILRE